MGGNAINSAIFVAATAVAGVVHAREPAPDPFSTDCQRLSAQDREELGARVQLLLRSATEPPPRRIVLVCDERSAWLEWDGPPPQEFDVDTTPGLVEGALDAIEDRVRSGGTPATEGPGRAGDPGVAASSERSTAPAAAAATAEPFVLPGNEAPPPFDRVARTTSTSRARLGGAGLAMVFEPLPSDIIALGPRLEVGVGLGPLLLLVSEGVRFGGSARYNFLLMDLSTGLGYGAPFDPTRTLGVLATTGLEWASGYPSGTSGSSQISASGTFTLGVRAAQRISGASFWIGIDGRLRASTTSLGSDELELPQIASLFSIGGALLVDGADRTPKLADGSDSNVSSR